MDGLQVCSNQQHFVTGLTNVFNPSCCATCILRPERIDLRIGPRRRVRHPAFAHKENTMLKKIAPALFVAALAGLTALPAAADDLSNALGGALGGAGGAAVGGALGGQTGSVIGGAIGGGAGGALTANGRERKGAIVGGAVGGGVGAAAGNAMGGRTGGIVGAGLGGGAGAALGGNVQRNSYSDRDDRGYRRHGKHHHHHH
jgi:hypothetical protein